MIALLAQSVPPQITNSPAETALRYVFAVAIIALTTALVWMTRKYLDAIQSLNEKRLEEQREVIDAVKTLRELMDREDRRQER